MVLLFSMDSKKSVRENTIRAPLCTSSNGGEKNCISSYFEEGEASWFHEYTTACFTFLYSSICLIVEYSVQSGNIHLPVLIYHGTLYSYFMLLLK